MKNSASRRFYLLLPLLMTAALMNPLTSNAQQQLFSVDDGLNVRNISVEGLTKDGAYAVAVTTTRKDRLGVNHNRFADPTYIQKRTARVLIINTGSGEQKELFEGRVQAREFTWSPDGETLAFFLLRDQRYYLHLYDRNTERLWQPDLDTGKEIASNSLLEWRPDGSGLILELRNEGWRAKADSMYRELTEGPIIIQDANNDFLAWDRIWNINDQTMLAAVDLNSLAVSELTGEGVYDDLNQSEDGSFIAYTQRYPMKTDYERSGDSEYEFIRQEMDGSTSTDTLIARTDKEPGVEWNHAGSAFAYAREGKVFVQQADEDTSGAREITEGFYEKVEEGDTTKVSFSVERWHPEDSHLLLSSDQGYYLADPEAGGPELVYALPENKEEAPRREVVSWSTDGRYLYMTYSERDRWQRGLTRFDLDEREMESLMVDSDLYSNWEFAEKGNRILFESSDGNLPAELYASGPELNNPKKLTDMNPWLENRAISRSELIRYMDVDGDTLYGVLYYPANYEEGKQYPLVAYIYEDFFDNGFQPFMNILASEGYFVFRPSVDLEEGYPGEAWMKGVTTGINKLMEAGLVDGSKLGVQGVSYGGYAANLLITQTDRFAAAVNNSGKVNMISFLGDSPKITTRNYDAAEVGQDRIGETLWEATDKYIAHSAIFFVDRIETPLLILSGEGDWNVPATNQREMYYAMRRLGKEVKWVHYMQGGHGAGRAGRVEDYHHHWDTVLDWYKEKFYPESEHPEE